MDTLWHIDKPDHGTFLMYGNYCVAKLDDYEDGVELGKRLSSRDELISALRRSFSAMKGASERLAAAGYSHYELDLTTAKIHATLANHGVSP